MRSHFKFSKKQRNGIFLLLCLILLFQGAYYYIDLRPQAIFADNKEVYQFRKEVDSLRLVALKKQRPKRFPFNPNYIDDYKGYTLGMSTEEIDRLLKYRKLGKWVNSSKQFQEVTQVSDSLLHTIAPYFRFPEWVAQTKFKKSVATKTQPRTFEEKKDLNTATAEELQEIHGIGKVLSSRIIRYRNRFVGGFIADVQLTDVYGLTPEVITRLTREFTVKTPAQIQTYNLNQASVEELVTVQYIDYELAYEIVDQRTLHDGFKSFDELTKVKGFPVDKIEIIKLYLTLK